MLQKIYKEEFEKSWHMFTEYSRSGDIRAGAEQQRKPPQQQGPPPKKPRTPKNDIADDKGDESAAELKERIASAMKTKNSSRQQHLPLRTCGAKQSRITRGPGQIMKRCLAT